MTQTPRPRRRTLKRNLIWGAVIAVVALVTVGASLAFSFTNEPEPKRQASGAATPSASAPVAPSPTPTMTEPTTALPNDCREIYTPEFLELWAGEPLNDPALVDVDISRYSSVENLRESLAGIECKWGAATEGGMSNAVNQVTPAEKADLLAAATAEGFACVEGQTEGTTVCGITVGPSEDDEWVMAEELYFRDGLVVTTWRASTVGSISDSSQPVYDTLWP
jgi:hypothetical protein